MSESEGAPSSAPGRVGKSWTTDETFPDVPHDPDESLRKGGEKRNQEAKTKEGGEKDGWSGVELRDYTGDPLVPR